MAGQLRALAKARRLSTTAYVSVAAVPAVGTPHFIVWPATTIWRYPAACAGSDAWLAIASTMVAKAMATRPMGIRRTKDYPPSEPLAALPEG